MLPASKFLRTLRILFHCIVTLVSRTLLRLSSDELLHSYLVHFKDSLLLDCYVGISRTFRIPIQWIVTLLSRALLRSSFNGLVPLNLAHLKDSIHCIVTLVSRALLGLSSNGLLRS